MINLSVVIERHERGFDGALADKTRKLVQKELEKHDFTGIWRLAPTERKRSNRRKFWVARTAPSHYEMGQGLIIYTMVDDRDTSWECILIPPQDYDIEECYEKLRGLKNSKKPNISRKKSDKVVKRRVVPTKDQRESHSFKMRRLRVGAVYIGEITDLDKDWAVVKMPAGIYTKLPCSEWSFDRIDDLKKCCKLGDYVKVQIVKVSDEVIVSRKAAVDLEPGDIVKDLYSFNEIPDENGFLSLQGFTKEGAEGSEERKMMLIAELVDHHEVYDGVIPAHEVYSAWEDLIKKKYGAKSIGKVASLVKSLTGSGLLLKGGTAGKITYEITDTAWDRLGGEPNPETVDDIIDEVADSIQTEPVIDILDIVGDPSPCENVPEVHIPDVDLDVDDELVTCNIGKVRTYLGVRDAISKIEEQERELREAKQKLQEWMNANQDCMAEAAKALRLQDQLANLGK